MSVFAKRERTVTVEGRRFVCRPPTVDTIDRLYGLYGREIWALGHAYYHDGHKEIADPEALFILLLGEERGAELLSTCVTAPGETVPVDELLRLMPSAQATLARVVLSLCNVGRIVASLELERATDDQVLAGTTEADEDVSGFDAAVIAIAQAHGCSPMELLEWPYEAFLASESFRALAERRAAPTDSVSAFASPTELAASGYQVLRPKARA